MKKLTDFNLLSLLGGWANPEECKKVQERVPFLESQGENADWGKWLSDFDTYCLGI